MESTATFAFITPPHRLHIMDEPRARRDWWKRGRAFDLWSIPHFLFGVLMCIVSALMAIPVFIAFTFTGLLAVFWEIAEEYMGVRENILNSFSDIVLSIMAFVLTYQALLAYPLNFDTLMVIFVAVLSIYTFTNVSGWLAFRRRNRAFRN